MTTHTRAVAAAARYLGALALLGVGIDHLVEFSSDSYSAIPTIGTLFALNFVAATVVAAGLAVPVQRLPGRAGRLAVPLLALSGVGVAAGSLAALLVSEGSGLFGFREVGYRPAIVLSIAFEVAAIALLGAYLGMTGAGQRGARSRSVVAGPGPARTVARTRRPPA
jgi:hypothetical protein